MNNYAIAAILFTIAAILWLSVPPPEIAPLSLTPAIEVTVEEYQRGIEPHAHAPGESCALDIPEPRFFPSPLPMPPEAPERVPGRNLPVFATEEGGRALTEVEMGQWRAARAADPAYQDAVRRMQAGREWRASTGNLTAFDGGRCTLAQSAEKCREERARMEQNASQWLRDSQAARERGEP